jgi:hypothetical protein
VEGCVINSDAKFAHFLAVNYSYFMEIVQKPRLALAQNNITATESDTIANASQVLIGKLVVLSQSLGRKAQIQ